MRAVSIPVALLATAALLAPVSAIAAGSVESAPDGDLLYRGDAAANAVTITGTPGAPGIVTFAEAGITEGADDANVCGGGAVLVTCSLGIGDDLSADGADGTDNITVEGAIGTASLTGGTGNDELNGSPSADLSMNAGPGSDRVFGRGGNDGSFLELGDGDLIDLGAGRDFIGIVTGDGSGDTLRGGPGLDTLGYGSFGGPLSAGFRVDLAAGHVSHGGIPGEAPDTLEGFEDAGTFSSGDAADTLIGTDRSNILAGGGGGDTLVGGAGTDTLLPDHTFLTFSSDLIVPSASPGADTVRARDGFEDRIDCFDGNDTAVIDQFDPPSTINCEDVQQADVARFAADRAAPNCRRSRLARRKRAKFLKRGVRFTLTCNEEARLHVTASARIKRFRKRGVIFSRAGDVILAERRLGFASGARRLTLRPVRKVRKALGRRFKVRLRIDAIDRAGNRSTKLVRFRVR